MHAVDQRHTYAERSKINSRNNCHDLSASIAVPCTSVSAPQAAPCHVSLSGRWFMRINLNRGVCALCGQYRLWIDQRRDSHQVGNNAGPSGLVARAEPGAVFTMKIFVKENQIFPVGIVLKGINAAINRAFALVITEEDIGEAAVDLCRNLI